MFSRTAVEDKGAGYRPVTAAAAAIATLRKPAWRIRRRTQGVAGQAPNRIVTICNHIGLYNG
jgi:hypothetical protein